MRPTYFIHIALFALIAGVFLFSCTTTPTNPYDISNTKIYLVARTSTQLAGKQGLADSIGNPITAGFSCNLPDNLDSVQLKLALANGTDSIFKSFTNFSSDTLWQTIVFEDTGIKTIKGVAYIKNYNKPYSDSIFIHIYGKPFNHAPVLRLVSGQTTITPKQICLLTVTAIDTDLTQKDSIMLLKGPFSKLNDSTFKWTPDSNSIGIDTAVFMAWDNGYPIMRDTLYVVITVTGTSTNHAPKWQDKTLNEVGTPGNAINLTLSDKCSDIDGDHLTFSLLSGQPSNDSIANAATAPTYTFTPGPGDTGVFNPQIVASDPQGLSDTMTIHLTIKTTPITDTAKALTTFSFTSPAASATITESSKTVALSVPSGTDVTALVATFVSTGASVKVGTVVQTSGTTPNNFTSPVTYTVVAGDGSTQAYVVTVTVSANTAKALTSFSFASPAAIGTITESSKTVALSVPSGTDVTALVATFVSTGASVKVGTAIQTSGTTPNNFTSPVTYTVVAGDGSTQAYVVTVIVSANTAKALTSFSFASPAVTGTINDSSKTVAVSVPSGTNVTALKATFVSTGTSVKVGTVVQTSGTTPNNFTNPVTYTVVAADGSTRVYVVTVTVVANSAKALTSFSFASPAVTGTINDSSKTVAITVPSGTDVTALKATFVSTGASVKVGTVVQTSGTTPNNFTSPVTYTVTAADGSTQAYVVTITVGPNTAKALTSFSFASPAISGTITESSKTVAISVPFGTDLTALVATFVSTGASVKVGTVVQTSGTTPNNFTSPVTYTVVAGDGGTQAYVVTVTIGANPAKALTSFTFASPAVSGTINESAKTVALTVPFGTNVTALVATFVSTGASVKVGTVVQTSGTTPNNFTGPVTYTVVAADGGTQAYVVTVTIGANAAIIIATQPKDTTKCLGSPASFSVSANTVVGTLSYQWKNASGNLTEGHFVGTTTNSLSISAVASGDAGTYSCYITSTGGGSPVTSSGAILTVNSAPSITTQPTALSKCVGDPASFTVAATGAGTLTYQWQKDGANVSSATAATYSITSVSSANVGSYTCIVTGGCGSVTSGAAALAMKTTTSISTQPSPQSICAGAQAAFTVVGAGDGTLSYQWKKDGTNVSGATAATYTIASAAAANAGSYTCVVTGGCGSATSSAAALTIKTPTSITTQPSAQTVCAGAAATFTVVGAGDGTLSYQWQKGGVAISGATSASYSIPSASSGDAANYSCVVTGGCGPATSSAVALNINTATSVTNPISQTVLVGSSVSFSVTGSGTGTLTYQWKKDGGAITGANTATYNIPSVASANAGTYTCTVIGGCGTATSSGALLTVTATYSVTYAANGSTSGSVPTDAAHYTNGQTVTVLGNTGLLKKTGYSFGGWTNSQDNLVYQGLDPFTMGTANVTLTAKWNASTPTITSQPTLQGNICHSATLTISATGSGTLLYQWYKNGVSMGSSGNSYSITVNAAGTYKCIVTDGNGGTATSNNVTYNGALTISITFNPVSYAYHYVYPACDTACQNGIFTLTATAGGGSGSYTYYWSPLPDNGWYDNKQTTSQITFDENWDLVTSPYTFYCTVTDVSNACTVQGTINVQQGSCIAGQ